MTREEARKRLRGILTEAVEFENSVCYVTEEDREPLEMAIKALEQTRWIPVSERLPEEDNFYLITAKVGNELIIDISEYTPKNDFWDIPHEIVAWLPLPKPYKAESEDV